MLGSFFVLNICARHILRGSQWLRVLPLGVKRETQECEFLSSLGCTNQFSPCPIK